MTTNEIIAQIIGIVLIGVTLITPQAKSRTGMLAVILLANLLSCGQFYFVNATAGLFALIVTTARSFVYWLYSTKNKKAPNIIFFSFVLLQMGSTIIGWADWISALTLVLLFNTYGQWQTNEKVLRICLLISAVIMGFYCLFTGAYTGALNKWLQTGSVAVALWRFRKNTEENKK
ncbi:hypothetical protein FACS1894120_6810 [Clostridia bacterium]|nr:hypothetical protein FACS1894120_6810 [Clostridia bacterium]